MCPRGYLWVREQTNSDSRTPMSERSRKQLTLPGIGLPGTSISVPLQLAATMLEFFPVNRRVWFPEPVSLSFALMPRTTV